MTTISASSTAGVYLSGSFTNPVVINKGVTISGTANAVAGLPQPWTIVNNGSIEGANSYNGIYLRDGGSVTNAATALISGYIGVNITAAVGTVVNSGRIVGSTSSFGVYLGNGGVVTNAGSGYITGGDAVYIAGAIGTVVNSGTMAGSNLLNGVYLGDGGLVTNAASASIRGGDAVNIAGTVGTVVNSGTLAGISGGSEGVLLDAGGSVTNQSGGTISGYIGVELAAGGTVTNAAGASITGVYQGVFIVGGTSASHGTVVNQGRVTATGTQGIGVELGSVGTITNTTSAVITGTEFGVELLAGGTLTNAGTIVGSSGTAVVFGGTGSDLLVLDPGYTLSGIAVGATSATNTLELASAASVGTLSGLGTEFRYFTQVAIESGATWQLAGTNTLAAGATVTNSGTLIPTNATLTGGGATAEFINDGLVEVANGGTANIATPLIAGTGSAEITGSSELMLNATSVVSTQTISFGSVGTLLVGDISGFKGTIGTFASGDQIIVNSTAAVTFALDGLDIDVVQSGATIGALSFATATAAQTAFNTPNAVVDHVICFCIGTLIATPDGEVPVEKLQPGDRVLTLSGEARRIVWVGSGRVTTRRGQRDAATPVIVRKGALADNVPHHDLHVTKGHSFYLDDVLIPVEFLVNHRSITWDDRAQQVEIFHIELETHDILLANGAPAESYRDDGNRWLFRNANSGWALPAQLPFAPVLTGGPVVDAVWRRLLERAGPRPAVPTTDDPDLHLMVDGRRVNVASQRGGWHVFRLAAAPGTVRIVSRTGVPQEMGLSRDPRSLGVALRQIMVTRGRETRTLEAEDALLRDNFHGYETDNDIRWTDGDAGVPACLFEDFAGPLEIALRLGGTTCYLDTGIAA
ncbi:MAG TPA: Hint domain-containing protein [Acetobacteraceae bacterium]|nr:Hint domain-containing protein [Acetobacteraceae bacterium]